MMYHGVTWSVLTVMLLAASWAAFGVVSGTAASVIVLLLAAVCLVRASWWTGSVRVAAVVAGLSAVVGLVLEARRSAKESVHCVQCANHLRQIGMAVRNYWDARGCHPPACSYDEAGHPMHSWRLFLKPYLDASATLGATNLNEPWDSPSNQKHLAGRQIVYQCPADKAAWVPRSTATSYVAIVDARTLAQPGKVRGTSEKRTGQSSDAFLVVEMANSGIQWAEPKDIAFDEVRTLQSLAAKRPHVRDNGYFYCKTPVANALLVQGDRVFVFPCDTRASVLAGLSKMQDVLPAEEPSIETKRRGKDRGPDFFEEELRVDWLHVVGLPVWTFAMGLLVYGGVVGLRRRGL